MTRALLLLGLALLAGCGGPREILDAGPADAGVDAGPVICASLAEGPGCEEAPLAIGPAVRSFAATQDGPTAWALAAQTPDPVLHRLDGEAGFALVSSAPITGAPIDVLVTNLAARGALLAAAIETDDRNELWILGPDGTIVERAFLTTEWRALDCLALTSTELIAVSRDMSGAATLHRLSHALELLDERPVEPRGRTACVVEGERFRIAILDRVGGALHVQELSGESLTQSATIADPSLEDPAFGMEWVRGGVMVLNSEELVWINLAGPARRFSLPCHPERQSAPAMRVAATPDGLAVALWLDTVEGAFAILGSLPDGGEARWIAAPDGPSTFPFAVAEGSRSGLLYRRVEGGVAGDVLTFFGGDCL